MNRAKDHNHFTENNLCLNCYQTGHHRYACPNHGIVACSICFLTNISTQKCNHKNPQSQTYLPRQNLRFVEGSLMYIDVDIYGRKFEALINSST